MKTKPKKKKKQKQKIEKKNGVVEKPQITEDKLHILYSTIDP